MKRDIEDADAFAHKVREMVRQMPAVRSPPRRFLAQRYEAPAPDSELTVANERALAAEALIWTLVEEWSPGMAFKSTWRRLPLLVNAKDASGSDARASLNGQRASSQLARLLFFRAAETVR